MIMEMHACDIKIPDLMCVANVVNFAFKGHSTHFLKAVHGSQNKTENAASLSVCKI